MKRSLVVMMALLLATPALWAVTITCTDEGLGVVRIDYDRAGEPSKIRAFALDVTLDCDATFSAVSDYYDQGEGNGYGIFPGTIDLSDLNSPPVWGDPIAPSSDPGASGTGLGTGRVILEMGSLYEPNLAGPSDTGTLCRLTLAAGVDANCAVNITVETTRGGIVLESGASVSASTSCNVVFATPWPACWDCTTQCHGDSDCSMFVDTADWPDFRDGFYKSYPDAVYQAHACGDYNKDGSIDTVDWPEFRDNFYTSPPPDCPLGDPYGIW